MTTEITPQGVVPVTVTNNVTVDSGEITVVGLPALPAGANNIGAVDVASSALPSGAATSGRQDTSNVSLASIDVGIAATVASASVMDDWDESDRAKVNPIAGQAGVQGASGVVTALTQRVVLATDVTPPLPSGAATETTLAAGNVLEGAVTEAAPATDTASSGLNGRLQRIAQRLTSIIALLPAALGSGGGLKVDGSGTALPVSGTLTGVTTVTTVTAVTAITNALPAGTNAIGKLAANSGVDIGDVDVTSIAAGDNNIGNVDIVTVPADPFGANADAVVAAGAVGSIQAKLRRATQGLEDLKTGIVLAAGSAAIGKLAANSGVDIGDVDVTTLPNVTLAAGTNTNEVVGDVAEDAALAGNPVRQGVRASTAVPTAMSADGDVVTPWANRSGALVVAVAPHTGLNSDPFNLVQKGNTYTSAQTGAAFLTPTGGKKLVITKVHISIGGTVAGTWILWFGASGDTSYTRGTDRAIFDGEFAPSTSNKPQVVMDGPWIAGAADDVLRVTGVGAINPQVVSVWYYEI